MDTCGIKIENLPNVPITDALRQEFKNDTARFTSAMLYVLNADMTGFSDKFLDFYKDKFNLKTKPAFKSANAATIKKLVEAAVEFTNKKSPRITSKSVTSGDRLTTALYNYSSPEARTEGQRHVSNVILEAFKNDKFNNIVVEGNKAKHYLGKARAKWNGYILARAAQESGRSREELAKEFKEAEDKHKFIDEILGGKNKSEQNQNMYAVWCELNSNNKFALEYVNDLFNDPLLNKVLDDVSRDLDELIDQANAESNPELNGETSSDVEDSLTEVDSTVADYDHSGVKKDFNKHVSDIVKIYFDTLPKLTAPSVDAYDTNNHYGLPTRMSSQECIQFMYSINEEFDNIESMIKAIENAAKNVSKFHAFVKFAEDLRNNQSFANEVFSIFAKPKYESFEVVVEGDKTSTRVPNPRVNKTSAMTFDFLNNIKASVINNSHESMSSIYDGVKGDIDKLNTLIKRVNDKNVPSQIREKAEAELPIAKKKAIASITRMLKLYFPSIEAESISSYLELNKEAYASDEQFYKNCLTLRSILADTLSNHAYSLQAFRVRESNIQAVKEHNKRLDAARVHNWIPAKEYKTDTEFKTDDYISGQIPAIRRLVEELKPYTAGNIRINDRNIHGNNQSAILNSSWISGLKHMMDKFYTGTDVNGNPVLKNDELIAWGTKKLLATGQYRNSTLLVEQTDENGVVLNKDTAIFRIVNNTVELTKNADKILKVRIFNGSSNLDDGSNMSYPEMTKGDFLPTSFMMFFTTNDINAKNLSLATYFPKTPSDAPNAFGIQSIRYNATQLVKLKNPELFASNLKEIIEKTTPLISVEDFLNNYIASTEDADIFTEIFDSELVNKLTSTNHGIVSNARSIKAITEPDDKGEYEAYVTYQTKSGVIIVSKGTVHKIGKSLGLKNVSTVGVVAANLKTKEKYETLPESVVGTLSDYYKRKLDKGDLTIGDTTYAKTEYTIDTEHPVFKMIRNQFKQEVIDAATAVSHYFEIRQKDNGRYEVVLEQDKNGNWRPVTRKGADLSRGYKNYHIKGKSVITYDTKTNSYHLTGNVFSSDSFIAKGINFFENIFEEKCNPDIESGSINLLYGGAMELVCDNNGKVVDVVFTEKQLAKINECLSGFLNTYFDQVSELVNENRRFIKNVPVTKENIVDYAANNLLMMFNFDYLLDGSPKFYKSNQDVIKRVKQYQGSGTPYGSADYSATFNPNVDEAKNSFLNNGTISRTTIVDGKKKVEQVSIASIFDKYPLLKGVRQRNGYYAVTIANTKRTNTKVLEILRDKLIKECGVSEQHADEIIYGPEEIDEKTGKKVRTKGYQGTKVNDAQSYITIQEFVRRLSAKGQLKRYLPLIERLMDESKPISAKDITEFIQVQKNFYYDMFFDERYGIEVPRQIKNAEFVLIPRFIKGTQLMRVYEAMQEAGIDQLNTVETSKAANERVLQIWDNDANFDEKVIQTFISQAKEDKQIYSYNNLYTQQETPQHMDAENKAGIQIMKKMLDNIPTTGHPLSKTKKAFFDTYTKNIEESCLNLLKRLEVPVDKNGDIQLNDNGTIKGYNSRVLYERMLEEARRTGVNNNQKDYFDIPEGDVVPRMVSYMNNYLSKFESVFQSMFNSAVTRQKLPGFHAAQITNVGFKPYGDEAMNVSYSKELRYHPDGEPYIEVMVPYKALGIDKNSEHYKNMTDEEILAELKEKGLLDFIGYRIPTEGKQSVAIMRIAGFLDDSQGSTIVVPDDWVSQTGSDFDIDSVYTILHEHETTRTGEIVKVEFKEADKRTLKDWFRYLHENAREISKNASEEIKAARNKLADSLSEEISTLIEEEQDAYTALPDKYKNFVKDIIKLVKKRQQDQDLEKRDKYVEQLQEIVSRIDRRVKNLDKHPELKQFRDICADIADKIYNYTDYISVDKIGTFDKYAKNYGLLTYEEFMSADNDLSANTKKARNSRIADLFLDILRSPAALEENLSRSNFDKITEQKAVKMPKEVLDERANRNPHNIADQISYQEEVMSGRSLKGMSVALDTMCSVCNTVQPTLNESITIVYNADEIDTDSAKTGFDAKIDKQNNTATVIHNQYGWSKNNRTVDGYILTSYSSQTTAYILDAVKEGAILNVNTYTFPVWKTLANIGCNYGTSIAFMVQPAVTQIVQIHNAKNSVFNRGYGNEINEAIKVLAKKIDPSINTDESVAKILSLINTKHKGLINEIFGITGEEINFAMNPKSLAKLPIVSKLLDDRINKTGKFKNPDSFESAIFDLGITLIYSRLHGIASRIGNIARCCNPDKFGAKQTVYSTRKTFDNIIKCLYKEEEIFEDFDETNIDTTIVRKERKKILTVGNKHILEAIYPGVANERTNGDKDAIIENIIRNGDISSSAYPPLFAFLKYSTCVSATIAKEVFDTQHPIFTSIVEGIGQTFSGANKEVSEEIYNDFQKYLLGSMYNNVPAIKFAVQVRKVNGKIQFKLAEPTASNTALAKEETARIWGFGRTTSISTPVEEEYFTRSGASRKRIVYKDFDVVDITNPTDEEMSEFEQLSPAQKVWFIQTKFPNAEIFDLLQVNLANTRASGRYKNAQTIQFIEEKANPNDVFRMFSRAFESDNPLIASAAIDIVKYAVQVEGMRTTATAVNKIIDNDAFINSLEDSTGLGFVDSMRTQMRNFGSLAGECGDAISIQSTYENYLRTLPANIPIRTIYLTESNRRKYHLYPNSYGTYRITADIVSEDPSENQAAFNRKLVKMGIKYTTITDEDYGTNRYIQLNSPEKGLMLFKIHDLGSQVILTPLTKLEQGENSQWSANPSNNAGAYLSPQAYDKLIASYETVASQQEFNSSFVRNALSKIKEQAEDKRDIVYVDTNKNVKKKANPTFNIEKLAKEDNGKAISLIHSIVSHFSTITSEPLFVNNGLISENIFAAGADFGTIQTITFPNGDKHQFSIFIPRNIKSIEQRYLRPKQGEEKDDPKTFPSESGRAIIEKAADAGLKFLSDMAVVMPVDNIGPIADIADDSDVEANYATIEDKIVDVSTVANSIAINSGNHIKLAEFGNQFKNNLLANDISPNVESVKKNQLVAMQETASFAVKSAKYIRDDIFDRFVEDPESPDAYIAITDPRIQDMIAKDAALMDKYMQAVNMAKAFLEKIEPITHEKSNDQQIQGFIDDIKKAVNDNLEDIPLDELFRNAGNVILKTQSTNPLVHYQFIDVMDGYWRTYGSMWNFFSIMENGTPILQTILSDVMTNLDAKQKMKHKMLKQYRRRIDDIIARAKVRGEEIDIHKIIDDSGNFVADYTQEFIEKLDELRTEVHKYPLGSINHLRAKLAYDKFLLEHVNREAYDKYYRAKLYAEEQMLNQIPELYSEYMKLFYRKQEIYDYANKDNLTEELKQELQDINGAMQNLYLENGYVDETGEFQPRESFDPEAQYTPEELHKLKLYSVESAKVLGYWVNAIKALNEDTFENKENLSFRRTLNANLNLIRRLERRVNGIPTVSQDVLNQNPDYVKAVQWIKDNAYFSLNAEYNPDNGQPVTLGARIFRAFEYLRRSRRNTPKHDAFSNEAYRDVKGVLDGRKLTEEERELIKFGDIVSALPITKNAMPEQPIDRTLISNRKPDGTTFSNVFYKKLAQGGNPKGINYYQIVTELNKLLEPYLGAVDGYIHFERIPDTAEGIAIVKRIAELYNALAQSNNTDYNEDGEFHGAGVSDFIKNEVEFATNDELFKQQVNDIANKSSEFKQAILGVFYIVNSKGEYVKDENGNFVPNRFLYGYAKPKGNPGDATYDKYVSTEEQESRALIDKYYETVPTEYYHYAKEEAIANGTYDQWYEANHWYNPFTRRVEPISCWMQSRLKSELFVNNEIEGKWIPKAGQSQRRVKNGRVEHLLNGEIVSTYDENQDRTNHDFKPNAGYLANYKLGSGFDSGVKLNQGEREMLQFLKSTLMGTAKTSKAKRFFEKGHVPRQAISNDGIRKTILKELGKSIGIGLTENNGYNEFRQEIGYAEDEESPMPMLTDIDNKVTKELYDKLKNLRENPPVREELDTDATFEEKLRQHNDAIKETKEQLAKERASLLNHNWYDVIENYLSQAAEYNAVLDNKNKLYFLLNILKDMKMYSRQYGSYGDLKKQKTNSDGTKVYQVSQDKQLIEQYENFLRRLLFNEWKESEGKLTSFGNFLQGFASANYMMLNVRGGIANVTLGETGILAEAKAKEYIGTKDWAFGTNEYRKGIISYTASAYHYALNGKERFYSKQDAIIKTFNVVDYDEVTGIIRNVDMNHYATQVRNFMFSPQTMGEHFMQNSVLFAVLHSHKIFDTEQGVMAMSKNQYVAYKQVRLLNEILDEEQIAKFEEFKDKIRADKDELAKYAWFRRDAITRFIYLNCSNEQRKEYIKRREEQRKKFEQEFDAKTNIYEQLELTADGELGYVAGSDLARLDQVKANTLGNISEAQQIISKLSEKTRKINNKIHGIYNKREAAHIESKWYGSLVMQYHKHIPMGLIKRYLNRGHWNEFRNSVDKGMVQSVYDFMALNVEKVQKDCGFTKEEATALQSFMFNFTHCFKILSQLKATLEIIPDYEKANMLRNVGDLFGTVAAIATTAALWAIAEDDDPDGFWFNLCLYEADRLASESFMFNPYGMIVEGKKLMSTPIAAGSVINDALNLLTGFGQWMFDEDYDPYYQSGRFAGEHKASVYIQRRIPIWNGIRNLIDISDNNHYYKVGANSIGLLDIKEKVRN